MRAGWLERAWRGIYRGVLRVAACSAVLLSATVAAQPIQSAPEHSIKAAYLYNFAAYIEWPEQSFDEAGRPLTIGILGGDRIAGELEAITRDRRVGGHPVRIRRLRPEDPVAGLHMLFVADEQIDELPKLTAEARAQSVVVVTESRDALRQGSVINFLIIDERVRFEVSLEAADASRLAVSSRLLAVAERVLPGVER